MAVLQLRTDGTVDEGAASSSSAAAAEAPTQATMATMMVTPETLTGTGGGSWLGDETPTLIPQLNDWFGS